MDTWALLIFYFFSKSCLQLKGPYEINKILHANANMLIFEVMEPCSDSDMLQDNITFSFQVIMFVSVAVKFTKLMFDMQTFFFLNFW